MKIIQLIFGAVKKFQKLFVKPVVDTTCNVPTTTILIKVGDNIIGAAQSISLTKRPDAHFNVHITRARFDKQRVSEAFRRDFINPNSQILPLQIEINEFKKSTKIENAWITNCSYTYCANDWFISENIDLEAEKIEIKFKY